MKGLKTFWLIFAIAFAIPGIFLVYAIYGIIDKEIIVNNGKEAVAVVKNYQTDSTINGVSYYYINFVYEDENGEEHFGSTSSKYTYDEVKDMTTLKIKYIADKAIEADYKFSFTPYWYTIALGVFLVFDVGFWIAYSKTVNGERKEKEALIHGEERVATFVRADSTLVVNGVPCFWVEFDYTNKEGEVVRKRTRSIYTVEEKNCLEYLKQFKIKVLGDVCVISEDINLAKKGEVFVPSSNTNTEIKEEREENARVYRRCVHCGSIVPDGEKKCPGCGSRSFEIEKR